MVVELLADVLGLYRGIFADVELRPPVSALTGRAYLGLALLGWGLSILLGVTPHEDLLVANSLATVGGTVALLAGVFIGGRVIDVVGPIGWERRRAMPPTRSALTRSVHAPKRSLPSSVTGEPMSATA